MKKEGKGEGTGEGARWKQGKGRNPFENPVRSIFLFIEMGNISLQIAEKEIL